MASYGAVRMDDWSSPRKCCENPVLGRDAECSQQSHMVFAKTLGRFDGFETPLFFMFPMFSKNAPASESGRYKIGGGVKPPPDKRVSRAFLPGGEVLLLLGGQLVEAMAHGLELQACDFAIEVLRHHVHLRLEILVMLHQVFRGQRLVGEAHVHH